MAAGRVYGELRMGVHKTIRSFVPTHAAWFAQDNGFRHGVKVVVDLICRCDRQLGDNSIFGGDPAAEPSSNTLISSSRDTIGLLFFVLISLIGQIILDRSTSALPLLHEAAKRGIGLDHDNSLAGGREVTDESAPHPAGGAAFFGPHNCSKHQAPSATRIKEASRGGSLETRKTVEPCINWIWSRRSLGDGNAVSERLTDGLQFVRRSDQPKWRRRDEAGIGRSNSTERRA